MITMSTQSVLRIVAISVLIPTITAFAQDGKNSFALGEKEFLLDGRPIQIISGEIHPARIPKEYWRHRIQMAKAMGCNTIAAYIFWNYHESEPGVFDFETGNHSLVQFFRLIQEEKMWALLRPGPYVCAEWDFGANSGGKGYEPDITSYDYDAPINEQGRPTQKYFALRELIARYAGPLPEMPDPIPVMEISNIEMEVFTSVWNNLPEPVHSVQPKSFEAYNQDHGFIIYKTNLLGHKSGRLTIIELHDYATVFLNGEYVGKLDRREAKRTIELPKSEVKYPILEILVEGMGRINFAQYMIDRKGITDRVTLNGMTLMNWDVYNLPFDEQYVQELKAGSVDTTRRGVFFKGGFTLDIVADTYIDVSNYQKGIVWVNGHNLGRFWDIGPQKRLYCPGPWLRKGKNDIVVFDLLQNEAKPICGKKTLY